MNTSFCPQDDVTREQMAAFMHRLAANRVVLAGELQGRTAKDINTSAGASYVLSNFCFPFPCTPSNPIQVVGASSDISIDVTEITFVAPTAGYLLINASTSLSCGDVNLIFTCGDPNGTVYIAVDGENCPPALYDLLASDGLRTDSVSSTAYVAVDEGNVDVSVSVFNFDNDSPGSITGGGITVQFVPYNCEALGLVKSFSVSEAFIQAEHAMIEEGSE